MEPEIEDSTLNFVLLHPFTMCVVGPTSCGKSELVLTEIIGRRAEIISPVVERVVYVFAEDQARFHEISKKDSNVTFTSDLAEADTLAREGNCLLIFDDLMGHFSGKANDSIVEWFTVTSHHRMVSVIVMLHNPYAKNMRTVSLNTKYMVLYSMIRDSTCITNIARQFCPGQVKYLQESYKRAVALPYNYLFFDFNITTNSKYRVRNSLFPTPECEVYVPNEDYK